MNNIESDFIKNHKKFIADYLHRIKVEEGVLSGLNLLVKRSEESIYSDNVSIEGLIMKIFKQTVSSESHLESFLNTKPIMPHEKKENNLEVVMTILAEMLTSSLQYGKTTRGGAGQIGFIGQQEGQKVWIGIESDFKKICTEFFDITPFLDFEKPNFPEIGFYMNSKWEKSGGVIVQIQK